ncbi:hypothetical protein KBD61_00830 [Patescibacteria group bacterium]|nr:hypothetical protein [Patescibacteria group bacterium]MBP9709552.1 hypothetical protein [Patescibacteria group bacterium]
MLLPNWLYLAAYVVILAFVFGYVIYQRCTWKIVKGVMGRRLIKGIALALSTRKRFMYEVSFVFNGQPVVAIVALLTAFHGYYFGSAEGKSVFLLVRPDDPKKVKILYVGEDFSWAAVWVLPATAFILTLLGTYFLLSLS